MTNQNQLFEAMGYIDDNIAANAINAVELRKRKKPVMLITIAAAAVLSMLVGFAAVTDNFRLIFRGNNISQRGFTATLTDQKYTIPEEFETIRDSDGHIRGFVEMLPSEVYEKTGLTMLTSENFTETREVKMSRGIEGSEEHTWEPMILGDEVHMEINYCLYNKSIDTNVWFRALYVADNECYILQSGSFGLADHNADIVKLNGGELAMVSDDIAAFVLDGAYYRLDFDDYKNENIATIDNMKQVLADLGIYTPADSTN